MRGYNVYNWVVIELPVPAIYIYILRIIVRHGFIYFLLVHIFSLLDDVFARVIETHDVCWTRGFRLILYARL